MSPKSLFKRLYPFESFMNLDNKRSVNNILSSFCLEDDEAVSSHISSVGRPNDNSVEIVLDNSKHFKVCIMSAANVINKFLV